MNRIQPLNLYSLTHRWYAMVSADVDGECTSHNYDITKSVENEDL